MIKPEIDLELSINALKVYGIEPNIIKSMLANLQKIVNKKSIIPLDLDFTVWLTGHDKETIEQMYNDWRRYR